MTTQCPVCGFAFDRRRKDQAYCSPNCRKAKYQRQKRAQAPANSAHSHSKRQDNELLFDRSKRLAEMYYTTAPASRLGVLKGFIDQARSGHSGLRQILTNKMLLKPPIQKKQLFYCNSPKSYKTISQLANRYCWRFWKHSVKCVVYGKAPEPKTGEVICSSHCHLIAA